MINQNKQLYLNICYKPNSNQFEYNIDNSTWFDPVAYNHKPYFKTSNKYELKIWLDLNGIKLHERIILSDLNFGLNFYLRSYSLIKK